MAARSAALCVVALVVAAMVLLAPTQASFIYTEEDLASDDSMWALYERWAAHHEVACDKTTRFPIFKKNARELLDKLEGLLQEQQKLGPSCISGRLFNQGFKGSTVV